MKVKYFSDTDTALVEFNNKAVKETLEIGESVFIDVDKEGNIVNITIEHAKTNAKLPEFSYQEFSDKLKQSA